MSQFSNDNFDAINYAKYRPKYTKEIYKKVRSYHKGGSDLLIDVGCGPGTATMQMVHEFPKFKKFIGSDLSPKMINGAKKIQSLQNTIPERKLTFVQSSCDDFSFLPSDKKADMITAVECAHWFDFDKFQKAAFEKLNKNGTLAVWCYCNFNIPDYPKIKEICEKYSESDKFLGPFWEQPGHNIGHNYYKDLKFDTKLFEDIDESIYYATDVGKDPNHDKMLMEFDFPVNLIKKQLTTGSAYQDWKLAHSNDVDITEQMMEEILKVYPKLTEDTIIHVVFSTVFKFARRK